MKFTHEDYIGTYYEVIDKIECDEFITTIDAYLTNSSEYFYGGSQFDTELGRHDYSINGLRYLPYESRIIHEKLSLCIKEYAHNYFPIKQLTASSKEVKIQKTPPRGGYHQWHCEHFNNDTASRVLGWMVYLNDIPEGEGETEFIWQKLRIKPEAGKFVIWPASFTHTHRGNPVYSCDKYIATGWYTFDN